MMGEIPQEADLLCLGKLPALMRGAPCPHSVVRLQQGGSVGEDVSSGKPCLVIKDESVASWRVSFLSHPHAFSETVEQLDRPRLYRGQKVIVTKTFIMKSVLPQRPHLPFLLSSDSLHSSLIYKGVFFTAPPALSWSLMWPCSHLLCLVSLVLVPESQSCTQCKLVLLLSSPLCLAAIAPCTLAGFASSLF